MRKRRTWKAAVICLILMMAGSAAHAGEIYVETPLDEASEEQKTNIRLAATAMDGLYLEYGDEFSFNQAVGPRIAENGFVNAENGRGVTVTGGGVAQTATTLYLALMQRDDIEYSSIYTYNERFTGSYVESGYDAIVTDYNAGLDFAFTSYCERPLMIYMWAEEDALCCYLVEASGGPARAATLLSGSAAAQENALLAAECVNGWTVAPGEAFSFEEAIGRVCEEAGYLEAENAFGEQMVGGGLGQTATTLYLAARELEQVEMLSLVSCGDRFAGDYVDSGEDAVALTEAGGADLMFANRGEESLTLKLYVENGQLVCDIAGGQ